ncbi:hypothetical protein WG66_007848 [Moniliophthora roreri]|nr:hypothetical protein WG66_007848 [Moniliophthora roreri]
MDASTRLAISPDRESFGPRHRHQSAYSNAIRLMPIVKMPPDNTLHEGITTDTGYSGSTVCLLQDMKISTIKVDCNGDPLRLVEGGRDNESNVLKDLT